MNDQEIGSHLKEMNDVIDLNIDDAKTRTTKHNQQASDNFSPIEGIYQAKLEPEDFKQMTDQYINEKEEGKSDNL